jgi:hypothetical protein
MKNKEKILLNLIKDSENPTESLVIAINIIIDYLKQDVSSARQNLVCPQELA